MQTLNYNDNIIVIDYAHTPDAVFNVINTVKEINHNHIYTIIGCGGNRDKSKRSIMGKTVASIADFAVLTADNPRFEDPLDIIAEMERGYRENSKNYVVIPKRECAILYAMECLQKGDILLVAGKGAEKYQEIMGIKYPFEDNAVIKSIALGNHTEKP